MYGINFLSDDVLREWCRKFKDGWTDVHDEGEQEHKSVAPEYLVQLINQVWFETNGCLR